jgi:glucose-1-phosphate adenylyltransferase
LAHKLLPGAMDRDRAYWRDVGTLDAYYDAHMDLVSVHPVFNLYNRAWPIYSGRDPHPPAKFVWDEDGPMPTENMSKTLSAISRIPAP